MDKKTVKIIVSGAVQGVGFRYSTLQFAKNITITGYVRNLYDGRVEIVAQGDTHQIKTLLKWLQESGPAYAQIAHVEFNEIDEINFNSFSIQY